MGTEEEKKFIREIKEAITKGRGYADSFGWPPDRENVRARGQPLNRDKIEHAM